MDKRSVRYVANGDLHELNGWAVQVAQLIQGEPALLQKSAEKLERAVRDQGVYAVLAIDVNSCRVVGCVFLWPLTDDNWFELGTLCVADAYRFHNRHLDISDNLCRVLLEHGQGLNILATTTNRRAGELFIRSALQPFTFSALPPYVRRATCICPSSKTGAQDPFHCKKCDRECVMYVPSEVAVSLRIALEDDYDSCEYGCML